MPSYIQGCPPTYVRQKQKRVRNCDDHPTKLRVDPNFYLDKYSPVVIEAGTGGVARDISSFTGAAGITAAVAGFAGIAEDRVFQGANACYVQVHKCFEMEILLKPSPTVAVDEETFDPIAAPIYIVPWVDPDLTANPNAAISNVYFDTSLASTNAIGVVKELCQLDWDCDRPLCPLEEERAAPDNTTPFTPVATTAQTKVWAKFTAKLTA